VGHQVRRHRELRSRNLPPRPKRAQKAHAAAEAEDVKTPDVLPRACIVDVDPVLYTEIAALRRRFVLRTKPEGDWPWEVGEGLLVRSKAPEGDSMAFVISHVQDLAPQAPGVVAVSIMPTGEFVREP
jgi:hypothetical protein